MTNERIRVKAYGIQHKHYFTKEGEYFYCVLPQGMNICTAGSSDLQEDEITKYPTKYAPAWLQEEIDKAGIDNLKMYG